MFVNQEKEKRNVTQKLAFVRRKQNLIFNKKKIQ